MELTGYPSFVLYLILLVGLPLSIFRPYRAFLLVVFLVSAADAGAFTYTRTSLLGPYFNANDACLLVALSAMASYVVIHRNRIIIPPIIRWIVLVLIIGAVQSFVLIGDTYFYEVLRSLRWALSLPVYFVIAATLVDHETKVRPFLVVLFWGAVVSAVQHIIFVKSRIPVYLDRESIAVLRTITFRSPGLWLLLAGLIWLPDSKHFKRPVLIAGGVLFALSTLLNQTRSIWIASILVLPVIFVLYRQRGALRKAVAMPVVMLVLFAGVWVLTNYINPVLKADQIVIERLLKVTDLVNTNVESDSTSTRKLALWREMEEWSQGTLIFGRGLAYFVPYYERERYKHYHRHCNCLSEGSPLPVEYKNHRQDKN